jgi:hypothetical protein
VNAGALLTLFAVGAGSIALWVDNRFPRLAPHKIRVALVHVLIAFGAGQLVVPLGMHVLLGMPGMLATLIALFGVAFPALVYAFLTAVWVIRIVAQATRGLA